MEATWNILVPKKKINTLVNITDERNGKKKTIWIITLVGDVEYIFRKDFKTNKNFVNYHSQSHAVQIQYRAQFIVALLDCWLSCYLNTHRVTRDSKYLFLFLQTHLDDYDLRITQKSKGIVPKTNST